MVGAGQAEEPKFRPLAGSSGKCLYILGRRRQEDLWGLLASQSSRAGEPSVQRENLYPKRKVKCDRERHLILTASLYTHTHMRTGTDMWIHTRAHHAHNGLRCYWTNSHHCP